MCQYLDMISSSVLVFLRAFQKACKELLCATSPCIDDRVHAFMAILDPIMTSSTCGLVKERDSHLYRVLTTSGWQ